MFLGVYVDVLVLGFWLLWGSLMYSTLIPFIKGWEKGFDLRITDVPIALSYKLCCL